MVVDKINARLLPLELQIAPADNRGWVVQGTNGNPTLVRFVALEDAVDLALELLVDYIREEARDHATAHRRP